MKKATGVFSDGLVAKRISGKPVVGRFYAQDMAMLSVTAAIVNEMERQDVSRTALAERIGASKSLVSQFLNGSRNMTVRTLADLAGALGKEIHGVVLRDIGTTTVSKEAMDNHLDHWQSDCVDVSTTTHREVRFHFATATDEVVFA